MMNVEEEGVVAVKDHGGGCRAKTGAMGISKQSEADK
jgi:hypothetical protein